MRLSSCFLALLLALVPLVQAQQRQVDEIIDEQKVNRIVSALSADSMQGRKTFTPGIEKAADFIAQKYGEAGLEPLGDLNSFYQRFPIYHLQPEKVEIEVNGEKIKEGAYQVFSLHEEIHWAQLKNIENVMRISAEDDLRNSFSPIRQMNKDLVVLVDTAHRSTFTQLVRYFNRPTRSLELDSGPNQVFILTAQDTLEDGSIHVTQQVDKRSTANIVGRIPGNGQKDEWVIFSAHYDHLGERDPVKGDSIANGADDNASGTTALITLAEYFKETGPPERTLVFAAFTAEELGLWGSKYFSETIDPDRVAAMINMEMIGKPSKFGSGSAYLTGYERSTLGQILKNNLSDTPYSLHPDPYPDQNLFYRSDNASLARLGVPAHTISSVQIDQDSYYHTVNDEVSSLDISHLTRIIRAIALGSREIIQGRATPTRIK